MDVMVWSKLQDVVANHPQLRARLVAASGAQLAATTRSLATSAHPPKASGQCNDAIIALRLRACSNCAVPRLHRCWRADGGASSRGLPAACMPAAGCRAIVIDYRLISVSWSR